MNRKRKFTRTSFCLSAEINVNNTVAAVELIDLSLKGALISSTTENTFTLQQGCKLIVTLEAETAPMSIDCVVARIDGCKIGLSFSSFNIESLAHLRRLLELNLADPSLVERELNELFL